MTKDEVLRELEKHKDDSKEYSKHKLMNEGYRIAMMDAIDLVKNLDIPDVSKALPSDIAIGKAMSELSDIADKEVER